MLRGTHSAWVLSHLDPALSRCGSLRVDQTWTKKTREVAGQAPSYRAGRGTVHGKSEAHITAAITLMARCLTCGQAAPPALKRASLALAA